MDNVRSLEKGKVLFKEGDDGKEMFVIGRGEIVLTREVEGKEVEVAKLVAGDFLGEMAILTESKRTCTAKALTDVSILVYDYERFSKLIKENSSIAMRMLEVLSSRLKNTTNQLMDMHKDYSDHY
ncbi:cyclic nucleotide-binding domain-containing protein [Catenovulum sp. SM1970]|uniref:Crp/Fnr family transcriptional regulator n=1 Tax=Marinifaba aquimaris TaxID=2741323 RepID=UPI0015743260|nr:cyclic nucleotide-binding domain-containing protein [Marinifaba aquimaris]NTS75623.1 cyclic nucleotide-binding domain-containing protein [Marinifaba aquimaris]